MSELSTPRWRRMLSWLPFLLGFGASWIILDEVRIEALPEPVRVVRGQHVEEQSWESFVAFVLMAIAGVCFVVTTKIDDSAPPLASLALRFVKWTGWLFTIGGCVIALRLLLILVGASSQ